ncbi:hypothetical protein VCB98_11025 [Gammaproteobacteria bacterium AB-CW1]|uniref:Uncharacterized protein n=1 Tax=Natronospira elongata TaxID=3110268 RepID=A0AAP6MNA6_9GAMM|nr:hypothetical protein [Gammaproteobacteria bacterium AB-CW1]
MNLRDRVRLFQIGTRLLTAPLLPTSEDAPQVPALPADWPQGMASDHGSLEVRRSILRPLCSLAARGHFPLGEMPIHELVIREELALQWPLFRLMLEDEGALLRWHPHLAWYQERVRRRGRLNAKRKLAKCMLTFRSLQNEGFRTDDGDPIMVYRSPRYLIRNGGSHRLAMLAAMGRQSVPVVVLDRHVILEDPDIPAPLRQRILELDPA